MNQSTGVEEIPVWIIAIFPFAFLIIFSSFWCFVTGMLSYVGGWRRLASRFRSEEEPAGKHFTGLQGQIGFVSYRGSLDCTTNADGLFLRPSLLFRFGHPLIFIPWAQCHDLTRGSFLGMRWVRMDIGSPRIARIRLPARVFEETNASQPFQVPNEHSSRDTSGTH
ncbi:MAG: hypothetical protein P1U68_08680 [Verrucomicrobiales bacterium]|nr:hypothetical protein [Verrucomicrobiales bacterium]